MKEFDFFNFPEMETERLLLRRLTDQDALQIHKLRSDPTINAFVGRTSPQGIDDALAYIYKIGRLIENNECVYWGISLKSSPILIGTICYWNFNIEEEIAEIGYELLPEYQGIGIMMEVLKKVIDFGFEKMNISVITAFPSLDNTSSVKLLKKNEFEPDNLFYKNSHQDVANILTFTLRKEKYNKDIQSGLIT